MTAPCLFFCCACGVELDPKRPARFELCPSCEIAFCRSSTAQVALAASLNLWIQYERQGQRQPAPAKHPMLSLLPPAPVVTPDGEAVICPGCGGMACLGYGCADSAEGACLTVPAELRTPIKVDP